MKKGWVLCFLFLFGCSTVMIPGYLPNKKPYVKRFFANYDTALAAVQAAVKDLGWTIEKSVDPAIYEQMRSSDLDEKQVLLITSIRETPFVLGTRYARMNIYLRSKKEISEVEIRYLTMSSTTLKSIKDYSNDSETKRIFGKLEELINPKPVAPTP